MINLKQSRHHSLRFLITPSKRAACSSGAQRGVAIRVLTQCLARPTQGFVVVAREEMSMRDTFMHVAHGGINRAQAHRMRKTLHGYNRLAKPNLSPAAKSPRCRQVRIEKKCPIN